MKPVATEECVPTTGEEIANTISHGIGLALAIAATPILIVAAVRAGTVWNMVGASVFASAMLSLAFDGLVSVDGLAGRDRGKAGPAARAPPRHSLAAGRRRGLYGRRGVL